MAFPRRRTRFAVLMALAGLSLATTFGCSHDEPTASTGISRQRATRAAALSAASLSASGFSAILTFTDEYHPSGEKVLGTYADTVVAQVTFTGVVDWYRVYPDRHEEFILTYDASGVCPGASPAATAVGIYNDVGVHLPPSPCITGTSDRGPSPTQTNYGKFMGTLTARWSQYYSCGSETDPCRRSISTGVLVSVDPVQAALTLKPHRYATPAFQLVNFHADRVPTGGGNYGIPLVIRQWQYVQDDRTVLNPGCRTGGDPAAWDCSYGPQKSGTMTVSATVNGVDQAQSVHIRVLCRTTGDRLIDSLPVLDLAGQAWSASGDVEGVGTQVSRREQYFAYWCPPGGQCRDTVINLGTTCGGPMPDLSNFPGLIFDGHTHPYYPAVISGPASVTIRNPARDSLPDFCGPLSARNTTAVPPFPSDTDFVTLTLRASASPPIIAPHYVLDADNIYAVPGGPMSIRTRKDNTALIQRQQGACTIP